MSHRKTDLNELNLNTLWPLLCSFVGFPQEINLGSHTFESKHTPKLYSFGIQDEYTFRRPNCINKRTLFSLFKHWWRMSLSLTIALLNSVLPAWPCVVKESGFISENSLFVILALVREITAVLKSCNIDWTSGGTPSKNSLYRTRRQQKHANVLIYPPCHAFRDRGKPRLTGR